MPTLYDKSGEPVEVQNDQLHQYLSQGFYAHPKETFYVLNPEDQETYEITGNELPDALASGGVIETEDMKKHRWKKETYGDSPGMAAIGGAARGATFGLSDVALSAIGGEKTAEALQAYKEFNQTASTIGEVTGVVASSFVPGGVIKNVIPAAKVSQIGFKVGNAARSKIIETLGKESTSTLTNMIASGGGLAAAGALEGGLYGLGSGLSDIALNQESLKEENLWNPEGAAELLAGNVLEGALFGTVLGGGLGAAGSLGSSSVRGMSKLIKKAGDKYDTYKANKLMSDEVLVDAIGVPKGQLAKMGPDKWEDFKKVLQDETVLPDGAIAQGPTTEFTKRLSKASEFHGSLVKDFQHNLDDLVVNPAMNPKPESLMIAINDEVLRLEGLANAPIETKKYIQVLKNKAKDVARSTGEPTSFKQFVSERQLYRKQANFKKYETPSPKEQLNRFLYRAYNKELDAAAERTVNLYNMAQELPSRSAMADTFSKKLGAYDVDIKNIFSQYKQSKNIFHKLTDQAKISTRRQFVDSVYGASDKGFSNILSDFTRGFGYQMMWGRGFVVGAGRAAFGVGMKHALKNKAFVEMSSLDVKQKVLGWFTVKEDGAFRTIQKAFGNASKSHKGTVPASYSIYKSLTGKKDKTEAAREIAAKITNRMADPALMAESLNNNIGHLNHATPLTVEQTNIKATQLLHMLQQTAPRLMSSSALQPFVLDKKITERELEAFGSILASVFKPDKIMNEIISGQASPNTIAAFRMVNPQSYEVMKMNLKQVIANRKEPLTLQEQSTLAQIFDEPVLDIDWQYTLSCQEVYQQDIETAQRMTNTAPGRPVSEKSMEQFSNRSLSQSQALQGDVKK